MDLAPLLISLCALGFSVWAYSAAKRQSRANLARMRAHEEAIRSQFTPEQLAYFDRRFDEQGIARRSS